MKTLMIPVVAVAAALVSAPAASADDQGFLAEVSAVGLPVSDANRDVLPAL